MPREPIPHLFWSLWDCFSNTELNSHWTEAFSDAAAVIRCWWNRI